jgi:hypothetical protein
VAEGVMRAVVAASLPRPMWLPLDVAGGEQTPLVVCRLVVQLLAVIPQQAVRIAALPPCRSSPFGRSTV